MKAPCFDDDMFVILRIFCTVALLIFSQAGIISRNDTADTIGF